MHSNGPIENILKDSGYANFGASHDDTDYVYFHFTRKLKISKIVITTAVPAEGPELMEWYARAPGGRMVYQEYRYMQEPFNTYTWEMNDQEFASDTYKW